MNETNEIQEIDLRQTPDGTELKMALEAVLFAAGYPVPYEKLALTFEMSEREIKAFVQDFAEEYNAQDRGILLLVMDDCCQLCSKEQYKDYIRTAMGIRSSGKLSASCLEALAIIAYNQPVSKAYVEQVRGVDCSWAIGSLMDKQLIEQKGRLDAPGKPILYGTTDAFLRVFGLHSLSDLPQAPESFSQSAEQIGLTVEGEKENAGQAPADSAAESVE